MITIVQIADQALLEAKKTSPDKDITKSQARLMVQQSLAAAVKERQVAEAKRGQKPSPNGMLYVAYEDIPVNNNEFNLPATPSVSQEGYDVIVSKNWTTPAYIQLPHTYINIANERTKYLGGKLGYIITNSTGRFIEHPSQLTAPASVNIKILCPIEDVYEETKMFIPADLQENVLMRTLQKMGVIEQFPEDTNTDDVDQP